MFQPPRSRRIRRANRIGNTAQAKYLTRQSTQRRLSKAFNRASPGTPKTKPASKPHWSVKAFGR